MTAPLFGDEALIAKIRSAEIASGRAHYFFEVELRTGPDEEGDPDITWSRRRSVVADSQDAAEAAVETLILDELTDDDPLDPDVVVHLVRIEPLTAPIPYGSIGAWE
jgi:hypothetical protein